jgi:DnaA family protein
LQLSLPVSLKVDETFDTFFPAGNDFLIDYLKQFLDSQSSSSQLMCYLHGSRGLGKSHLLYAICHQANQKNRSAMYLDMSILKEMPVDMLSGLVEYSLICIDNVHFVAGVREWEVAIFDLINQFIELGGQHRIVLASESSPLHSGFVLPDLISRLSWGAVFKLAPRSEDDLLAIISLRLNLRGLDASDDSLRFLLSRVGRELGSLMDILDELDKKSLQAQRKVTIPFIKQVLNV